jgi:hypothetical protein
VNTRGNLSITRTRRLAAVTFVLAAVALAAWGCGHTGDTQTTKTARPAYTPPAELDRELTAAELDSLQSIRMTWGITRDEYWQGYGGVVGNDHVEVWYPQGKVNVLQGAAVLKLAEGARQRTETVFGRAPSDHLVIVCAGNLDVFRWATGRQWWHYSLIKGDTISLQAPIELHTRGILTVVAPREYYEWAIIRLSNDKAPRWVQEGVASYLAGEAPVLEDLRQDFASLGPLALQPKETEKLLEAETDRQQTRRAYYNAYRMVEELVQKHGEASVARFIDAMPEMSDLDAASQQAFGEKYDAMLDEACEWSKMETAP